MRQKESVNLRLWKKLINSPAVYHIDTHIFIAAWSGDVKQTSAIESTYPTAYEMITKLPSPTLVVTGIEHVQKCAVFNAYLSK